MRNGVSELFADLADEARVYGDLDLPVRVMRRRQRIARFAPVGVAALVVVASVLTYAAVRPAPAVTEDDAGDIPIGSLTWLPQSLSPPGSAPPLPTDRGVGPAAVVVWLARPQGQGPAVDPNAAYVVSTAGDRYRLPDGRLFALSPDGRWLLSDASGRLRLRDLTGSRTIDVGPAPGWPVAAAWTSDTLAVGRALDNPDEPATSHRAAIVDLSSGGVRTVSLARYPTTAVCGLRDNGDLVLCSRDPAVDHVELWVVDGRTGEQRSHVDADLTASLTPAERDAGRIVMPMTEVTAMPGGATVLVRTNRYVKTSGVMVPGDLLVVDVSDGRVARRLALPEERVGRKVPAPADIGGVYFTVPVGRTLESILDDGILLIRNGAKGTGADALISTVRGVELLDPATGTRKAVMTVSGYVFSVILRGALDQV
jgi:hypothetical protein